MDRLEDTPRLVSDGLAIFELTQADCPRVIDIFTAVLLPVSNRFRTIRLEEFPASSGVFVPIMYIEHIIGSNSISKGITPISTVQPVPAPFSTNELTNSKTNDGGNNQKLILFNLGKLISTAPICTGTK